MTRTDRMNYFLFLFGQLCFVLIAEAFHDTINIKIKNGDEIIELNWKRTGQYLANQNLPIWFAERNSVPRIVPQALSILGQFICYHDVEKSSAVVFFPRIGKLYGIVDTRFYIARLPLNLEADIHHEVGGNYIIPIKEGDYSHDSMKDLFGEFSGDQMAYINSVIAKNMGELLPELSLKRRYPEQHDNNIPSTSTGERSLNRMKSMHDSLRTPHSKILYPEILVFITSDIFHMFRQPNLEHGINMLLLYYITYFNSIDMLFAKLATNDIKIHINIAGLVIESQPNAFLYDFWTHGKQASAKPPLCFHEHKILHSFSKYIYQHKNVFVEDSFDFFFVSTGRTIGFNPKTIQGKSTPPTNVYKQRVLPESNQNYLGSVVHRQTSLIDYIVAARELASLMDIKYDLTCEGQFDTEKRCHSIMQNTNTHCRNCLQWTERNKRDLQIYVRRNLNHCFLLNFPRSIFPYGQPLVSLNPEDQCLCYFYPRETLNPFYMISIPDDSCDKPMQCSYHENLQTLTPLPIDGTPCGFSKKVCWQKQCVEVDQSHKISNSDKRCLPNAKKVHKAAYQT